MKLSTVNAIPTMTSNTSPNGVASASGIYGSTNDAFKAFDNDSSSYWRQLDNNGVYPQWLQYEFVESIIIGKYEVQIGNALTFIPTSWTFEGGNGNSFEILDTQNNVTWNSINETKSFIINNNKKYKVYRLTINGGTSSVRITSLNMYELTFADKFLISSNDKIYSIEYNKSFKEQFPPDMTNDTTPSPYVVSASSFSSASNSPYKAFDSNLTTTDGHSWLTESGTSHWLKIDFGIGNEKIIQGFHVHGYKFAGTSPPPTSMVLEGSNDNSTFTTLYENIPDSATWNNKIVYEFDNDEPYRYFRLSFKINSTRVMIRDFRLYEYDSQQNLVNLPSLEENAFINYGIDKGRKIDFNYKFSQRKVVNEDGSFTIMNESFPISLKDELGSTFSIIEYTDNPSQDNSVIKTETESYSVYDHISETPEVLVYTELNEDITVETTTEPFDIYDEFGDEVEVLYYTDDEKVNEADLILEANWSPIDELQGDFEVVTWTDEPQDSAQRVLEMVAIPKPQFVKLTNPKKLYGYLDEVVAKDISKSYRDEARYLFSNQDGNVWYVWDFKLKEFVVVDISTHSDILKNGMKWNELKLLTTDDWRTWSEEYMNIGVFLKDNPRDTITSIVDSISYKDYLPRNSVEVEKANFYILNTTAKIDLNIVGNTVEGILSDDDLTRVQYRILLNGTPYYPVNGDFTELSTPPQNINLTISSNDIKIDDWNTVKVEFRDFFGTTDFWQTNFIGTYSGLMFKDVHGDYYSNEIGEVLKYLDFGTIIAGQTTIEHEIILRNQYGYDVKNVHVYANTSNFPNGMSLQFSKSLSPFVSEKDLLYTDVLGNNDELSFYVRIGTLLNATPNANGSFDIIVRADKA